jgi:hypothetical protein
MNNNKLKRIWNKLNLCDYYLRRLSNIAFSTLSDFYFDIYIGFSIAVYLMKKYYHVDKLQYGEIEL